jgi:hypothetical protein
MSSAFLDWVATSVGERPPADLHLGAAFEIAVCRIEDAAAQHARDPIHVLSNNGPSGSRRASRDMFAQLGYTPAQIRIVRRLLAGSPGGWPGLLRLYLAARPLLPAHRRYLTRQLRLFARAARLQGDRPGAA